MFLLMPAHLFYFSVAFALFYFTCADGLTCNVCVCVCVCACVCTCVCMCMLAPSNDGGEQESGGYREVAAT